MDSNLIFKSLWAIKAARHKMIIPSFQAKLNDVMLSLSHSHSLSSLYSPSFSTGIFLSGNIWFIQWYNHFSSFALFHFRRGTKQELNKATTADALRLFVVVLAPAAPTPSLPPPLSLSLSSLPSCILSLPDSSKNDKWKQARERKKKRKKKNTNPFVNRLQWVLSSSVWDGNGTWSCSGPAAPPKAVWLHWNQIIEFNLSA